MFSKRTDRNIARILILLMAGLVMVFAGCEMEEQLPAPPLPVPGPMTPFIRGTLSIPARLSISPSDVWIKVVLDGSTVKVLNASADGTYTVDGLEEGKKYDLLFTSVEPSRTNFRGIGKVATDTDACGGWLNDVIAVTGGNDVGKTPLGLLGTIRGKVTCADKDSQWDIDVYIPGTSYIAKTDSEGNYAIHDVPQGTYTVRFSAPGYIASFSDEFRLWSSNIEENPVADLPAVELMRNAGSVSGNVKLPGRLSHEGIAVKLEGASANEGKLWYTDKNGDFTIKGLVPGKYSVSFSHPGFSGAVFNDIQVMASGTVHLDGILLSEKASGLTGKVVLQMSGSGEDVSVLFSNGTSSYIGVTDADGRFRVDSMIPGTYAGTFSKKGYCTETVEGITVSENMMTAVPEVTMMLSTGSFGGTVLPAKAGVLVSLSNGEGKDHSVGTSSTGSFDFTGIEPGMYTLSVERTGYAPWSEQVLVKEGPNERIGISLDERKGAFTGIVSLSDGSDPSSVTIGVKAASGNWSEAIHPDSNGSFTSYADRDGTYIFTFTLDGYEKVLKQSSVEYGRLEDFGTIKMKSVHASVSGKAFLEGMDDHSGISVTLDKGPKLYRTETDRNGAWNFISVAPGTYRLSVSRPGYGSFILNETVIEPSSKTEIPVVTIKQGLRSLTGSVVLEDASEGHHEGVLITASNLSDPDLVYSAVSNADGSYSIHGMIPGRYTIALRYGDYMTQSFDADIMEDAPFEGSPVTLLRGTGEIIGQAMLEGLDDWSGITVSIPQLGVSTQTEPDGSYSFTLKSGNYPGGLEFEKDGFATYAHEKTLTVLSGSKYGVPSVCLKMVSVPLSGTVTLEGASDNSGIEVSILGTGLSMVTEAGGSWSFPEVPLEIGECRILFKADHAPVVTKTIDIYPSKGINAGNTVLRPDSFSLSGTATLDGAGSSSYGIDVIAEAAGISGLLYSTSTDEYGNWSFESMLGGIEYEISFIKPGWTNGYSILSSQPPMSSFVMEPVVLRDEIPPQIVESELNGGRNSTTESRVSLIIEAVDAGTGVKDINLTWTGTFDEAGWVPYARETVWSLPDSVPGKKTASVKVKDRAGNETDEILTFDVCLSTEGTHLSGNLGSESLNWTQEKSPYIIDGNVTVPSGSVLEIAPGVDVLFNGDFSIKVEGTMRASGTPGENINFIPAGHAIPSGYEGKWGGIEFSNGNLMVDGDRFAVNCLSGSILRHCFVSGLSDGIGGYAFIDSSMIESDEYALKGNGGFKGFVDSSYVMGSVQGNPTSENYFLDTEFRAYPGMDNSIELEKIGLSNCLVSGYRRAAIASSWHGTFESLGGLYVGEVFDCNEVFVPESGISAGSNASGRYNNIHADGIKTALTAGSNERGDETMQDWSHNWWGEKNTVILGYSEGLDSVPFIKDSTNSPLYYRLRKVDFSSHASKPMNYAGRYSHGVASYGLAEAGPFAVGSPVEVPIVSSLDISEWRYAVAGADIEDSAWLTYGGTCTVPAAALGEGCLDGEGFADIEIQGRTVTGTETPPMLLKTPYRKPLITLISDSVEVDGATMEAPFEIGPSPYGTVEVTADIEGNTVGAWPYEPMLRNGSYTMAVKALDAAGNTSEKTVACIIKRPGRPIESARIYDTGTGYVVEVFSDTDPSTHKVYFGDKPITDFTIDKVGGYGTYNGKFHFRYESVPYSTDETFYVEAADKYGNIQKINLGHFDLTDSPEIAVTSVPDGEVSNFETVELDITMKDSRVITRVKVEAAGLVLLDEEVKYSDYMRELHRHVSLDTSLMKPEDFDVVVSITNPEGTVTSKSIHFKNSNPAPSISNWTVNGPSGPPCTVSFDLINHERVEYVDLLVDGNVADSIRLDGTAAAGPLALSFNIPATLYSAGNHEVRVEAVDASGYRAVSPTGSFFSSRTDAGGYGTGKTWNADGTLLPDSSMKHLFRFEENYSENLLWDSALDRQIGWSGRRTGFKEADTFFGRSYSGIEFHGYGLNEDYSASGLTLEFMLHIRKPLEDSYRVNIGSHEIVFTFPKTGDNAGNAVISLTYKSGTEPRTKFFSKFREEIMLEPHMYTLTADKSTLIFYIDGIPVMASSAVDQDLRMNALDIHHKHNDSEYYDSRIDEMAISSRVKSPEEISAYVKYAKSLSKYDDVPGV